MNGFKPVQHPTRAAILETEATFRADRADGGSEFLDYLDRAQMRAALEAINDAVISTYVTEAEALERIREALADIVTLAAGALLFKQTSEMKA